MREIFFDEKLEETRRNSEGCKPHGQGWELWEGWERWGGSGENSPRLTYSAIADNPEGGLAGKWRLKVGGLRIKNNFY